MRQVLLETGSPVRIWNVHEVPDDAAGVAGTKKKGEEDALRKEEIPRHLWMEMTRAEKAKEEEGAKKRN